MLYRKTKFVVGRIKRKSVWYRDILIIIIMEQKKALVSEDLRTNMFIEELCSWKAHNIVTQYMYIIVYITFFFSIHWRLQKLIHSSDTVFHAAGWSSNLQ